MATTMSPMIIMKRYTWHSFDHCTLLRPRFGAFNPIGWQSDDDYKSSPFAFLFYCPPQVQHGLQKTSGSFILDLRATPRHLCFSLQGVAR